MNAKEYLRQLSRDEATLKAKKKHLEVLRDTVSYVAAHKLDGMPRSSSNEGSSVERSVEKMADLEAEITQDEAALNLKKAQALDLIEKLDNPECKTILVLRYFRHMSWSEIAERMFYTERWVYKLHGFALRELDEILE